MVRVNGKGCRASAAFVCALVFTACAGSLLLTHELTYSARGTQAEVRHGFLTVENYVIPDVFIFVQQDGAAWVFRQRAQSAGPDGYHEALRSSNIAPAAAAIDEAALARGWYFGNARLADTPRGWVYVLWPAPKGHARAHNAAFVAPNAIHRFVAEQGLRPLPRVVRE